MKKILLLMGFIAVFNTLFAQTPVGRWRPQSMTTETVAGVKVDLLKDMKTSDPCYEKSFFVFGADGKISVDTKNCSAAELKDFETSSLGVKWNLKAKSKLVVSTNDPDTEPQTYNLEFKNNNMIWTMYFDESEVRSSPQSIRVLTIVFEKA